MAPYIDGVTLDRQKYLDQGWRGQKLAKFLLDFKKAKEKIIPTCSMEIFSLKDYVLKMQKDLKKHNPREFQQLGPIFAELEKDFFKKYDELPLAFCHGDYHPLNIIWSKAGINSVIDWEFCGLKPELYDVANMVGCLGMEHPSTLQKPIVLNFISRLKEQNIFHQKSWEYLVDLILANRFGWFSEWLRKKDQEMIDLEIDYWHLLLRNKKSLQKIWNINVASPLD